MFEPNYCAICNTTCRRSTENRLKCNEFTPKSIKKPPLGLKPKYIHDAQRKQEIIEAMERYLEAGMDIPIEWVDEYNQLCNNSNK